MYSRLGRFGSSPVTIRLKTKRGASQYRHVGRLSLVVSTNLACSIHRYNKMKHMINSRGQGIGIRGSASRSLITCTAGTFCFFFDTKISVFRFNKEEIEYTLHSIIYNMQHRAHYEPLKATLSLCTGNV